MKTETNDAQYMVFILTVEKQRPKGHKRTQVSVTQPNAT